jgi:hypothetical protein
MASRQPPVGAEDPSFDTRSHDANLRVDYVLPNKNLHIVDSAVFWPTMSDPLFDLVASSDHRLVWVDVRIPGTHSK